jgi:flavorubredoxin
MRRILHPASSQDHWRLIMMTEFVENSWYLRDALEIPGTGSQLPCNFFLVRGSARSILIDSGAPGALGRGLAQLEAVMPLAKLDYLFVTHGDLDHYRGAQALLARNPGLRILSNFEAMAKMNMFGGIPMERCAVVGSGDEIELGDRRLEVLPALLQDC